MITLEFQNEDSDLITELDLGNTFPGEETTASLVRLVNTGDSDVMVQLWFAASEDQLGTADETYNGSLLSLNGLNYMHTLFTPVDTGGFAEVYIKWRPTTTSLTGDKRWTLYWNVEVANVEDICDPLT